MTVTSSIQKLTTSVGYLASDVESVLGMPGPGLLLGADPMGLGQFIDALEPIQSSDGLVLSSMQNQLTVTISPNTIMFSDGSSEEPTRKDFPWRVAQSAEHVRSQGNLVYTHIGLRFETKMSPDSEEGLPSRALMDRLLRDDVLKGTGYDTIGASATLWYTATNRIYELLIGPVGNRYDGSEYFAQLNVRIAMADNVSATTDWLTQTLAEEYNELERVLSAILN